MVAGGGGACGNNALKDHETLKDLDVNHKAAVFFPFLLVSLCGRSQQPAAAAGRCAAGGLGGAFLYSSGRWPILSDLHTTSARPSLACPAASNIIRRAPNEETKSWVPQ